MELRCQKSALEELNRLAIDDKHSILICGVNGCGKTYLAKRYSKILDIQDFIIVNPNVSEIRKSLDTIYNLESKVVICIENLDSGLLSSSYTLLKFLEEPRENVYVVVTCCNMNKIPDTIISRSSVVTMSAPTDWDIECLSREYPLEKQEISKDRPTIWKSIKNFWDLDYFMNITSSSYLDYIEDIPKILQSRKPVSDIVWSLGHYPDNSELPVKFVMKYIISNIQSSLIRKHALKCSVDLDNSRLASHAILSKFVMECKYGD